MIRCFCFVFPFFIAIGCATPEQAGEQPTDRDSAERTVDEQLAQFDEQFDQLETDAPPLGEGDTEQTERRLAQLQQRDQFWRQRLQQLDHLSLDENDREKLVERIAQRTEEVDAEHTEELRDYLEDHPWPCRETVGPVADDAAFLLVQHADDDLGFQREVLGELEDLADENRTDPENFAFLYDRVAINEGNPQRFGTQGDCTEDGWQMNDVEEPDSLDERRAEVELMPIDSYRQLVDQMCEQMPE